MNTTEAKVLVYIQERLRHDVVTPIFKVITHTADGGAIWLATAGGMSFFKETKKAALNCIYAMGLNGIVVNGVVKNVIARHRPFAVNEQLETEVKEPKDYSFPSGHTAISFAAATALYASGFKKSGMGALCYATLVGISRIYLGVHYPTDVIGGAIIGCLIGFHAAN